MYLLGYDIGSSTIKAALVDAQTQEPIAVVTYPEQEMDIIARQSGWAEQQPEVWWQYVCIATQQLLSQSGVAPTEIKGIGIGYQMHGLVLIDKNQRVLRPAIIWCDSRAVETGNHAYLQIGKDYCLNNLLNAPGNFTAAKLKWIKDNEPDIYDKIHKILLPGDYIAMKLTGQVLTTISGLTEGIFWDFNEKKISQKVLDFFGFDQSILAKITPTFSIQGRVTKTAAIRTGLKSGTPITYRAGDQPNNALSLNVLSPGEVAATSGTSGVVYGIVNRPIADKNTQINTFAHVNYEERFNRFGALLCLNGAGIAYSWIKHQIARKGQQYEDMNRMISGVPVGAEGLCVLPFGNGAERIFDNQNIHAHLLNLEFNRHTRGHIYRAALEGVAFSFVYGVKKLKAMGLDVEIIRVGNDNMFQSKAFSMTVATLLNCHIEMVNTNGAIGAALAAGIKGGIYKDLEEALSNVQPSKIYEPRLNLAHCNQAYHFWCAGLDKIKDASQTSLKEVQLLKNKQNGLTQEIRKKDQELYEKSLQLAAQSDLIAEIRKKLLILVNKSNSAINSKQIKNLLFKLENASGAKSWASFEDQLNLVHSDLFKRLKQVFPTLTALDIKLCTYLTMQFSTKEIADRLHLTMRGVETRRYRLRKKLKLDPRENLIQFLEAF